jgi:Uma2 family endonuclease
MRTPSGPPEGYWQLAPDLAVEVVSPNDTASEVQWKVQMCLKAGVRLVWAVCPDTRSVMVYESLKEISTFTTADTLSGGNAVRLRMLGRRDLRVGEPSKA